MRNRKQLVLVVVLVGLAIAATGLLAWKLYPAQFRAEALVQVLARPPAVVFRTSETETQDDYKRYQKNQQAMAKCRLVVTLAIQERLDEMAVELKKTAGQPSEQVRLKTEITGIEDVSRKLLAEAEAVVIELDAPPRVRVIQDAIPPAMHRTEF
jgi:hypothetical protein